MKFKKRVPKGRLIPKVKIGRRNPMSDIIRAIRREIALESLQRTINTYTRREMVAETEANNFGSYLTSLGKNGTLRDLSLKIDAVDLFEETFRNYDPNENYKLNGGK